jgi:hypothetical protein
VSNDNVFTLIQQPLTINSPKSCGRGRARRLRARQPAAAGRCGRSRAPPRAGERPPGP